MKLTLEQYGTLLAEANLLRGLQLGDAGMQPVSGLTYESGKAEPGTLFVCKGVHFKKEYLEDAIRRGAVAYVSETDYQLAQVPHLLVKDIREAMPLLARAFYQVPEDAMRYVGITGTKGKTTTTYYIRGMVDEWMRRTGGKPMAFLTSLEVFDGVEREEASNTTPEAMELYRHFRNAADSGITCLTMEVSSQALKYGRVSGIRYDVGVFLNLSEDHISPSEHPDFQDYFQSKLKLLHQSKTVCVNLDSDHADEILAEAQAARRIVTFGTSERADLYGHEIHTHQGLPVFTVTCDRFEETFTLAMPGRFNVENALAAIAVGYALGIPAEIMKCGLETVTVDGRMEEFTDADGTRRVIVDYAHNGLSFQKIFESVHAAYPGHQIAAVFGCPGDKAFNRRKDTGETAGRLCDRVYLTADDPGSERVEDICAEIGSHIDAARCPWECIPDRETAIRRAIADAKENTVILVLGKGAETSQKVGLRHVAYPSDPAIVRACLNESTDETIH